MRSSAFVHNRFVNFTIIIYKYLGTFRKQRTNCLHKEEKKMHNHSGALRRMRPVASCRDAWFKLRPGFLKGHVALQQ